MDENIKVRQLVDRIVYDTLRLAGDSRINSLELSYLKNLLLKFVVRCLSVPAKGHYLVFQHNDVFFIDNFLEEQGAKISNHSQNLYEVLMDLLEVLKHDYFYEPRPAYTRKDIKIFNELYSW